MPDLNHLIEDNTIIQIIFNLFGGTAMLMFGVDYMGEGLEKASGKLMKKILSVLTKNLFVAFIVGTFITMLVQSSTAITVMTVGFVNAGLMNLTQAVGIIYGTNIGTTFTAQLMSLKLTHIALPVIAIGFFLMTSGKKDSVKSLGQAIMGFGLMFLGLKTLNASLPYIEQNETARYLFQTYGTNPYLALLVGLVTTMLVHSSAATVGMTISLFSAGFISFEAAIGLTMGDNIGTCITAQMASLQGNIAARRTAWAHTLYNIIGVIIAIILLHPFKRFVYWFTLDLLHEPDYFLVANTHTLFNIVSAIIFLPLTKYYVKFLEWIIRDKNEVTFTGHLDPLLISTPQAAQKAVVCEIGNAAELSFDMLEGTMHALIDLDMGALDEVLKKEEKINRMQAEITQYLVEISHQGPTRSQAGRIPDLINAINNFERVGDHCEDIAYLTRKKQQRGIQFSSEAQKELSGLYNEVMSMHRECMSAFLSGDKELAREAARREETVDRLSDTLKDKHIVRLEENKCSVEAGIIYLDIITHLERVADHLHNIALIIMEEDLDKLLEEKSEHQKPEPDAV